jgi:hypothetical protein
MPQNPRNWLDVVHAQAISHSSEQPTNLAALEKDLEHFHKIMSLVDMNGWKQHVISTLVEEENTAKVMSNASPQHSFS